MLKDYFLFNNFKLKIDKKSTKNVKKRLRGALVKTHYNTDCLVITFWDHTKNYLALITNEIDNKLKEYGGWSNIFRNCDKKSINN